MGGSGVPRPALHCGRAGAFLRAGPGRLAGVTTAAWPSPSTGSSRLNKPSQEPRSRHATAGHALSRLPSLPSHTFRVHASSSSQGLSRLRQELAVLRASTPPPQGHSAKGQAAAASGKLTGGHGGHGASVGDGFASRLAPSVSVLVVLALPSEGRWGAGVSQRGPALAASDVVTGCHYALPSPSIPQGPRRVRGAQPGQAQTAKVLATCSAKVISAVRR